MKDSNWKQSLKFIFQLDETKIVDLYNTLSKRKAVLEAKRINATNQIKEKINKRIFALKRFKEIQENKVSEICPEILPLLEKKHELEKQVNPQIDLIDKKIEEITQRNSSFDQLLTEISPLLAERKQLEDSTKNPELEEIDSQIQSYYTQYPEIESSVKDILNHTKKIDSKQKEKQFNLQFFHTPNYRDLQNELYINDLKLATIKYKVLTSPAQEKAYQSSPNPTENHETIQKNIEHLQTFFEKAGVSPSTYEKGYIAPNSTTYEKEVSKIAKLIETAPVTENTINGIKQIDLKKIYEIQNNILFSPPDSSYSKEDD